MLERGIRPDPPEESPGEPPVAPTAMPIRMLRMPDPDTQEILDTDWDTAPQEITFLNLCFYYFGPVGRKEDVLMNLLNCGVDESWFIHENRRWMYMGLFSAAMLISNPNTVVRASSIMEEAERLSGRTGWARAEYENIIDTVGIIKLDEFLEQGLPLWWSKLKKPKLVRALGELNMLVCHLPPTLERLDKVDQLISNALEIWRAEPDIRKSEVGVLQRAKDKILGPVPTNYCVPTGLRAADEGLNGGIGGRNAPDSGRLIVVCGRPGSGKTVFSGNLALRLAARNKDVMFWSFEMSDEQLAYRMWATKDFFYCRENGLEDPVTYNQLKKYSLTKAQRERIASLDPSAIDPKLKIFMGNSSMTADYVCNRMRSHAKIHPETGIFIIDHLGLLNIPGNNKAVAVGEATRQFKTTANELGIDVMLLCQLNRNVEGRDDKRPTLADLRDSGRIEEDADIVLGLYRESYYKPEDKTIENDFEILTLKNRQGESGTKIPCLIYLNSCALVDHGSAKGLYPEPPPPEDEL